VPTVPAGTVDFWQWGSGYVPGFNTLAQNFNTSQKVQVAAANPSDYWNKVVTTQAGGTGPDVFLMNNVNFKQWAYNKSVADVSSYLNTDKTAAASLQAMTPSLVDWYHYQGKAMGVPWDFSAGIVGFNVDQLQTVGLTSPNDQGKKWDWNMLRDYATKLTQKTSSAITRSGIWIGAGLENGYYSFCVANGGSFFNQNLDQCTIASPEAIAGLDFSAVIVTAIAEPEQSHHFVSRLFAPKVGIPEDPVTGSSHTVLGPFWADRLGRSPLVGLQASSRSGSVGVEVAGERVIVDGIQKVGPGAKVHPVPCVCLLSRRAAR